MESKQVAVEALMNSRRDKERMIVNSSFFSRERGHLARLSEGLESDVILWRAELREAVWNCEQSNGVAELRPPAENDWMESRNP